MIKRLKNKAQELITPADIVLNGTRPWDILIHDERTYQRIFAHGSLGLGESYMDGWWDCNQLDELFYRLLAARLDQKTSFTVPLFFCFLRAKLLNMQNKSRAFDVGTKHYNIGNELYAAMLDNRLVYTCAYWQDAQNLNQAQEAKLELVCKKIGLAPGMKVLDIGCGWGSFAKYAAEKYNVHVIGITISEEQIKLGTTLCKGLPVELRFQDYRNVTEQFDRIVSLGMFEHVGYKNYKTYMQMVQRCLKDDGLFLLHTIGTNQSTTYGDPWLEKYIFPNSMLPSIKQIGEASEGLLVMEDWHNFSAFYDKTLLAWFTQFDESWHDLKIQYDERFYRMWRYYLLSCAGFFRARRGQLWQVVFSKYGVPHGYQSLR